MKNLSDLLTAAQNVTLPAAMQKSGQSAPSFGIVNNRNGKRTHYSKGLVQRLGLTDTVDLMPVPEDSCILIARQLPMANAMKAKLKDDDARKISYATQPVHVLTEMFSLDYTNRSSMTFTKIQFDELPDGTPVAIVQVEAAQVTEEA